MKSDCAKAEHDELAEKLKIKQIMVSPFLRELIREEKFDAEDIEEGKNEKSESDIRKKEIEEELDGEEIKK